MITALPAALANQPFTAEDLRCWHLPPAVLRRRSLHAPTRGVRVLAVPQTLIERVDAFDAGLPQDAAFSHVTAAQLWGLSLPRGLADRETVDVMRATGLPQTRRVGCQGRRGAENRAIWSLRGFRVTGLADTWCDLGELAVGANPTMTLDDLVVVGDEIVHRLDEAAKGSEWGPDEDLGPAPFVLWVRPDEGDQTRAVPSLGQGSNAPGGLAQLRDALSARTRPRGKSVLTQALALVRSGARSPMETRSRLMFHRAGFPEPLVNEVVRDADGGFLLEGDLVWPERRVIGEYQGEHHASIKRRSADSNRAALAEDDGWRVLEIFSEDVHRAPRRIACLTRFARALGLDPTHLHIE
jgi:hypothetical protein